jgi:hypothetical protein
MCVLADGDAALWAGKHAALRAGECTPSLAPAGALSPARRGREKQAAVRTERTSRK